MLIKRNKEELSAVIEKWKKEGLRIGFVPTMGALHDGHLSLVEIAKGRADKVIVSIFVNPTQFAPHEDFNSYPRDETGDAAKLEAAGTDVVYIPAIDEIYPAGAVSDVKAGAAAQGLEGAMRPTHFDGVVTVVARLFDHARPDVAVFGEKDYQQLQVIKEMVTMMGLPVEIIGAPIARDAFGLALSSRNAYLSAEELQVARQLNVILSEAANSLAAQSEDLPRTITSDPSTTRLQRSAQDDTLERAKQKLLEAKFDEVQYVEKRWGRVLAAVKIGRTRLIDNVEIPSP